MDDATLRQNSASRPEQSTWVSANAGSGKTRVLTDRVARLLLSGTDPQKILCLTYTKAAAAEMQNRLFQRLGKWAMLSDAELRSALTRIGENGDRYDVGRLSKTRTYFARALETPGGLKIQTIHAFCANLLRRFPIEAGVSPKFAEIDEAQTAELQAQVLRDMAEGEALDALDGIARHLTDEKSLNALLKEISTHKSALLRFEKEKLASSLKIDPDDNERDIVERTMSEISNRLIAGLLEHMNGGEIIAQRAVGDALQKLSEHMDQNSYFKVEAAFLTKEGAPRKQLLSAASIKNAPHFKRAIDDILDLVYTNRQKVLACRALQRSSDLARFAREFLERYQASKNTRNLLDFDDLIERTHMLLSASEMTGWVLYRMDYGIDHILVDEAQDTSPLQWEIIRRLTDDLTSGETARSDKRTIFVVGDKKQSIFSFQGADPDRFTGEKIHFSERFRNIGQKLEDIAFPTSFRSAKPILELVDQVFADGEHALGEIPGHVALEDTPGRVDLWDFMEADGDKKSAEWWQPEDLVEDAKPPLKLAAKIANFIHSNIAAGTLIHTKTGSRPVIAGDFLVIVRSRSAFFHKLINVLKELNVPVAGADRLKLTEQLAVRDLMSLLKFLENDLDDLSLAEVLRSPIFGLSEQDLFRLAHNRKGSLWSRLRKSDHTEIVDALNDLRRQVDFIRPFELLTRILSKFDARRKLTGRLGAEAEDAIDELLAQSILFESIQTPTLTGFLFWISSKDLEIKRDMEAGHDEVRVMSIHGAKGLEAPVVILPDVSKFESSQRKPSINLLGGQPFWASTKAATPALLADVETTRRDVEENEYARLLYVALTRAENWLIVAGAGTRSNKSHQWYNRVEQAMERLGAAESAVGVKSRFHRWEGEAAQTSAVPLTELDMPNWIEQSPNVAPKLPKVIAPSQFSGAHALPGEITDDGTERGLLIHRLLEVLPERDQKDWRDVIAKHCAEKFEVEDIEKEVEGILRNPEFSNLFEPGTLSEVSLSATLAELDGNVVFGRVDRLVVTPKTVLAVDFKTNSVVPDRVEQVPKAILAQQAAYHAALSQIYPDREVGTAILWTKTPSMMNLPHALVNKALEDVTLS